MIFDLHNDILTAEILDACRLDILSSYQCAQDVGRVTLAVWTSKTTQPLELIQNAAALAGGCKKFCYAIEDLGFADTAYIDGIVSLNPSPLYAGLTWNYSNPLAGGALSDGGLTDFGKYVIKVLTSHGITLDTAHLNKQSFWEAIEICKAPLINSHCCFDEICKNPRNLDDSQISAIIQSGGLVGLTLVPKFLSQNHADIVDVFSHIDYFISRFGYKNLAIGTDFFGTDQQVEGFASYEDAQNLKAIMTKYGYKSQAIEAVFYQNAASFFESQKERKKYEAQ